MPVRQQVTLGDTTAVLTGTSASDGVEPTALRNGVLTISRADLVTVTLPITALPATTMVDLFLLQTQAMNAEVDKAGAGSLCLGRFSAGAAPVALLALTTGGAHCCFSVRAVPSDGGTSVDHDFGNYNPWLRQTASGPLLVMYSPLVRSPIVVFQRVLPVRASNAIRCAWLVAAKILSP